MSAPSPQTLLSRKFRLSLRLNNVLFKRGVYDNAHISDLEYREDLSMSENFMRANFYVYGWLDSHKSIAEKVVRVSITLEECFVQ